MDLTQIGAR